MEGEEFDVAVVGGGVMGSCAAYCLAQAGKSTVLIEQFPIPHSRGSSCGQSRITSLGDYTSPYMKPIINHGYKQWLKILATAAADLFRVCPLLTVSHDLEFMKEKAKIVKDTGFDPVWIPVDKVNEKYKTSFPKESSALIDTSGGVLFAQKCVQEVQRLFKDLGGVIVDAWPVTSIEPGDPWVQVKGRRSAIRAKSLVLCPGPWATEVLTPLGIDLPLKTVRLGVYYWKVKDSSFPRGTICDMTDPHNFFYAVSPLEYPGLIKVGLHEGVETTPSTRDKIDMSDIKMKISQYIQQHMPNVESEPAIEESCMYTVTPDEDFVMDYHPEHKNIVYAVGFSGRGFKYAPAIGEMLAGMVQGHDPIHDLSPFSAARFANLNRSSPVSKY
ncbi:peroxisomal sarcosine oxidase-like [Penaeus chinensis]|uniref:peroxisomal sarcosine oxidase-like n=1 Tax=Penaeus chinensis TaxID=139456 RepID=UPI001FB78007|nr:peroxisomal sarcosine oxidase-like [Penaeus chinensis]